MMMRMMVWMTPPSKIQPSVVVDTAASDPEVFPEAMASSANGSSSPWPLLEGTLKADGVWATRSWYGS